MEVVQPPMHPAPLVIIAGAQRFDPTIGTALRAAKIDGPFAMITAGWREREPDDGELRDHLGGETYNLDLYRRADDILTRDTELREAHRQRQVRLQRRQDFYRIRLKHQLRAAEVIANRTASDELHAEEQASSIDAVRQLDTWHLSQCRRDIAEFEATWTPWARDIVAEQRSKLSAVLDKCPAVVIAGGHVAALLNRLELFGMRELLANKTLIAWSAGAMAITERVVLYHDFPPQGFGASEVLAWGLGALPNVVALPQPEYRLNTEDKSRIRVMAQRFAPSQCIGLPARTTVTYRNGNLEQPNGVLALRADGTIEAFERRGGIR
ncbi:MAG: hypothetical protein VX223_00145 [Myxococcota bacterium]|nr:hypothetical protein [Myxococcota bacterium]